MNESAFPYAYFDKQLNQTRVLSGMTLRDYFAAKAMQGAIAHGLFNADKANVGYAEYIANIAYVYADAMLKARGE